MTTNAKPLIDAKRAEDSQTTQYTATNVVAIVDTFTVRNTTAGAVTFAVNVVPSGGTVGAANIFLTSRLRPGRHTHALKSSGRFSRPVTSCQRLPVLLHP